MQRQKLIVYLTLAIVCLLGAREASADAWCQTRPECHFWAKRFVARAYVSCFYGVPVPMCSQRDARCGNVEANCNFISCAIGGGRARATNGPAGCFHSSERSGLGLAGNASDLGDDPTSLMGEDKSGGGETLTNARFDEAARTVEIRLESGRLAATPGGLGQRLKVWIFRDEIEADEDEDPVPTDETTLWTGSVALSGGELTVTGFDPAAFTLSTDDLGRTVATFADVATVVPLDLSAEDFAKVVVQVVNDEFAP